MPIISKKENTYQLVSPIIINTKDSSILIEIPAGEFEMGDGGDKHTVYLDRYYIGVYTVTNRQYKQFVDETGQPAGSGARRLTCRSPSWRFELLFGRSPKKIKINRFPPLKKGGQGGFLGLWKL
jgi:formylglycine-generating enzyme required for sulfatase activity